MSQTAITKAFEAWLVDRTVNGEPARPDKMVFAFIPGLDPNVEINRLEGMPSAAQIRHTANITQYGALNKNAVVYSVVLDTTIGNWAYNWVGLIDSASGTVLMIVHLAEQQKIKTENGQQGNSLIRNLAMEFDGAATASQINVTPATWMIDYSARLQSMDESRRMANVDYYGAAAFQAGSFKVSLAGATATIASGLGYVAGLRAILKSNQSLALGGKKGVWVDICWSGTVTGAWANSFTLRAADTLADYIDSAGFQHYVTRIASINGAAVTDERQPFPLEGLRQDIDDLRQDVDSLDVYSKTESDKKYLHTANNLSEIAAAGEVSKAAARTNLDVSSKTDSDKKYLQTANNLSEIAAAGEASKAAARTNLDVSSKTDSDKKYLQTANNLSEIATAGAVSQTAARKNIKVYSQDEIDKLLSDLSKVCPHRINDVIFRASNVSPTTDYPGTTWVKLPNDAMIRTANATASNILQTGGRDSVTLTINELPAHSHDLQAHESNTALDGGSSNRRSIDVGDPRTDSTVIKSTGNGQAFSILNSHVTVVGWRRTA
ncbi:hypothetical protein FCH33_13395 [Serratia fonticola]|uniref:phage tail-collar fiber domain-containing protein n=1 Tax=Serratia fonticola TaxID=47917 RepID=UPI001576E541|nr:phage tail protein [Serratia fonticola]NTY87777.1 hypothetical protein [Serratia fonticola]NTZ13448.1 hypothetical protein [Serratia fonticola]